MGRSLDRIRTPDRPYKSSAGTIIKRMQGLLLQRPEREPLDRGFCTYTAPPCGDCPHKYIQDPLCEPEDVDNVIMRARTNETRAENSSGNRD